MYIHRVALSVVLPQQEPKSEPKGDSIFQPFPPILEKDDSQLDDTLTSSATPQISPGFAVRGSKVTQSLPRKLKQKTSEEKPRPRSSIQSDHIVVSKNPKPHRRHVFTKQHSIHESNLTLQGVSGFQVCTVVYSTQSITHSETPFHTGGWGYGRMEGAEVESAAAENTKTGGFDGSV